ncbi:MAG: SDR family oxidoreductase [Candidatus Lokiarchaeota archaeon]|nr:SDR family oxidoreductase [Candidatus Lokiarchaeota archaeon]
MNILITGSNRGIGLEFTKQYLLRNDSVIATCRSPTTARKLQNLKKQYKNRLMIVEMDVSNFKSIQKAYEKISGKINSINILINNAGIISGNEETEYRMGTMHQEDFLHVFNVNSIAPVWISERFLNLLVKGSNPKIINITSRMGSITEKTDKSHYSYCMSKAALNMASKLLANDLESQKIGVWAIHPGWSKTDMGGYHAPLDPKKTVSSMIRLIDGKTIPETGKFLNWDGKEIPW